MPIEKRNWQESGTIIVFVAFALVILLGMIGLAIDLGHAYVNKSQLQNIADACALAGASALDGQSGGIVLAQSRAIDTGSYLNNKLEFTKKTLTIDPSWVTYSASLSGTWVTEAAAQALPNAIAFVRVTIPSSQSSAVLFGKAIPGVPNVINLGAEAVAGRSAPQNAVCTNLDPFAVPPCTAPFPACSGNSGDINHGYVVGQIYESRFSPGNSGKTCGDYGLSSQTGNFGLADPSGQGPSSPVLQDTIKYGYTPNCVQIQVNAEDTTTGNKGKPVLDAMNYRFNEDTDTGQYSTFADYTNTYLNSSTNFRRIFRISFTDGYVPPGNSGQYNVTGFGCFWMPTTCDTGKPSSAICLMYVGGSCSMNGGAPGNSTSPSVTRLVLFQGPKQP